MMNKWLVLRLRHVLSLCLCNDEQVASPKAKARPQFVFKQ